MAIIVILVGATTPVMKNARTQAQQARVSADLDTIKTAAIMLHHDTGSWPPTGNAGAGLVTAGGISSWNGPYLDRWNNDPWNTAYAIYDVTGTPTQRWGRSLGADAAVGGTGNDADIAIIITPDTSK